jgi:phosphoribosylanthranilate isomerase
MMRPCFLPVSGDMASTRIKICGITRREDAQAAASCGVDAVGLVFYAGSSRSVTPEQAQKIVEGLPPFVTVVALFVNEPAASIARTLKVVPIDLIQFHGEESQDFCRQFGRPWIKALRVKPGLDVAAECDQYRSARGVLLDSWQEGKPGGTGKSFNWQLVTDPLPLPLVLAGGLNESNVGEAIATVQPGAVDVSGGVESAPGIKDAHRIRRFVEAVRVADQKLEG